MFVIDCIPDILKMSYEMSHVPHKWKDILTQHAYNVKYLQAANFSKSVRRSNNYIVESHIPSAVKLFLFWTK